MESLSTIFKVVKAPLWNPYFRPGYHPPPYRKLRSVFRPVFRKPKVAE